MRKFKIKHVISLTVLLVMLAVAFVPSVMASAYHWGCEYSIPTGSQHWNGSDHGEIWTIGVGTECRYNVSILSSRTVEVHGSIFKEVPKSDDLWIAQVRFSGANGTWQGRLFVPESGSKYYSRITEATAAGVYGRTSVTVM